LSIHDRVRAKIEAGVPRHAQAVIEGHLVSLHPGPFGFGTTFSGNLVVPRPFATGPRLGYVRAKLIDLWVRGEASVAPGTFTPRQLEHRASEHEHGNGPGILQGARDAEFAKSIRDFAAAHASELADGA
jgi:hypothetical protein